MRTHWEIPLLYLSASFNYIFNLYIRFFKFSNVVLISLFGWEIAVGRGGGWWAVPSVKVARLNVAFKVAFPVA